MDRYVRGMNKIKISDKVKEKIILNVTNSNKLKRKFYLKYKKRLAFFMFATLITICTIIVIPKENIFEGTFTMKVYAESANEMKNNIEMPIGKYNPAMSTTPGFPFRIIYSGADYVKIKINDGNLLLFKENSSEVVENKKEYNISSGKTIYWSPLDNNSLVKKTNIYILAYKNDKIVSNRLIQIYSNEVNYFAKIVQKN